MTDTAAEVRGLLDSLIRMRLTALELRVRADLAASGSEDEAALDVPPDPDAAWQRVTVEEVLVMERARLEACRDALLVVFEPGA